MAFNFGAFAGGAAQGFKSSFQMMREEEERQQLMEERRQAIQARDEARAAGRETLGRVGSEVYDQAIQTAGGVGPQQARGIESRSGDAGFDRAVAESAVGVLRENAGRQGALPQGDAGPLQGRVYSEADAMSDYSRRMAAIDPDKAIAASLTSRQMRRLDREDSKEAKLTAVADAATKRLTQVQSLNPDMGLYGLAQVAKKNGLAVEFVEAKDETSPGKIVYTDPNTKKKVEFTSFAEGQNALGQAVMGDYLSQSMMFVKPDQAMGMLKDRLMMSISQRQEDRAEAEAPGKRALTDAQTRKANAEAGSEGARQRYFDANAEYIRGGRGKDAKPEVSNADLLNWVKENKDSPSDVLDKNSGKPIRIGDLPQSEQRRLAAEFYTGKGAGGMPDIPQGGLKKPEPKGALPKGPLNKYEGQKFGLLTPQWMIDEAAAAGNPDAIRYKEMQAERKTLPTHTGIPF